MPKSGPTSRGQCIHERPYTIKAGYIICLRVCPTAAVVLTPAHCRICRWFKAESEVSRYEG